MEFIFHRGVLSVLIIIILYLMAGFAIRKQWEHLIVINPLKIISNASRRASLSSMQLLFFSLIMLWIATYWVLEDGTLVAFDNSILSLLGIAVAGSGIGKVTDATRFKVTAENWAWAKKKNWIKKDFTKAHPKRSPKFADLITSEQGFDIARFQAVGFSLVLGVALFYNAATAETAEKFSEFTIDEAYLFLIGISQGAYVGGKYVSGNLIQELNVKLDKVRSLEILFTTAVVKSVEWKKNLENERDNKFAREMCAPSEYEAFISAAIEGAEIVGCMTGNTIDPINIQPRLPL